MSKFVYITRAITEHGGKQTTHFADSRTKQEANVERKHWRKFLSPGVTLIELSTVRLPIGLWSRNPTEHVSIHSVPRSKGEVFF